MDRSQLTLQVLVGGLRTVRGLGCRQQADVLRDRMATKISCTPRHNRAGICTSCNEPFPTCCAQWSIVKLPKLHDPATKHCQDSWPRTSTESTVPQGRTESKSMEVLHVLPARKAKPLLAPSPSGSLLCTWCPGRAWHQVAFSERSAQTLDTLSQCMR